MDLAHGRSMIETFPPAHAPRVRRVIARVCTGVVFLILIFTAIQTAFADPAPRAARAIAGDEPSGEVPPDSVAAPDGAAAPGGDEASATPDASAMPAEPPELIATPQQGPSAAPASLADID